MLDAFREADDVLRQGVQGITDLITIPDLINLDFADVRTIMQDADSALMGISGSRPQRQHHLRLGDRREHGRRCPSDRDHHRLRLPSGAPHTPRKRQWSLGAPDCPDRSPQISDRQRSTLEISDDDIDVPPLLR